MRVVNGMHHIRKHILCTLSLNKWARFRDMRPQNIDSNLYNYHLKELMKEGYIERNEQKGYRLSPYGLRYVNQVSMEVFEPRWQPKLLTVLVCKRGEKLLVWKKYKQPYIGTWSLPGGKVHYEDASIRDAAIRDILAYSSRLPSDLTHVGIFGYRTFINGELINYSFAHVFTGTLNDDDFILDRLEWVDIQTVKNEEITPSVKEIVELCATRKSFFFDEQDIDW